MTRVLNCALLVVLLAANAASATPPEPAESRLLKVTGGGFTLDTGPSNVIFKYAVTLEAKQPTHPSWYLTVAYENPTDPNAPLTQDLEVAPNQAVINCQSEEVRRLENGRDYVVTVRVYKDAGRRREIDRLSQRISFQMDMSLLNRIQDGLRTDHQTPTPNAAAVTYAVYENQDLGVRVKYPESWHVKVSATPDVRQLLFSRESVDEPPGKYIVGMQIMQFFDIGRKATWLDLSNPDTAADQWLNATLQATPGQNELVDRRVMTVGGMRAYYAELRMQASYPMRLIKLTMFYPTTFSELICEAPEEEFEQVRAIFEEVIHDERLAF